MKYIAVLVFLFFIVAAFYVCTRPLEDISIKDLPMSSAPVEVSPEPVNQQSTLNYNTEAEVEKKAEFEYHIILESLRNLGQAQQKAEKLKNDLNADVIVLPPSKEGYYRISYGKYTSIEEARSASKSLKTTISRDIWILPVEK
jgi:septal ring-binding cell division protein DamX